MMGNTKKNDSNELREFIKESLKKTSNKLIIITGPYSAGKTTYKVSLAKKRNSNISVEYPYGIDVTKKDWADKLRTYGKENNTNIVETHLDFGHSDSLSSAKRIDVNKIFVPKNTEIHFVLPDIDTLYSRQLSRDKETDIETTSDEISWYKKMLSAFKKISIVVT